ncbi:hypothetical protein [Streptomyces sp. Ru72]|uniref:hypothetical protein n=1 Tax=Streptomyces sp. Ru72 TaxID=2080747 RepID=UPI0011B0B709|nr:hypothetical protein [Streptomyces sp. Ru72]
MPLLDAVATHVPEAEGAGELTVLAVNRHQTEDNGTRPGPQGLLGHAPVEHSVLAGPDLRATNTPCDPERVRPRGVDTGAVADGRLTVILPPLCWNAVRLRPTVC